MSLKKRVLGHLGPAYVAIGQVMCERSPSDPRPELRSIPFRLPDGPPIWRGKFGNHPEHLRLDDDGHWRVAKGGSGHGCHLTEGVAELAPLAPHIWQSDLEGLLVGA